MSLDGVIMDSITCKEKRKVCAFGGPLHRCRNAHKLPLHRCRNACVFLGGVFFRTVTFWRINHSFFGYWRVNRYFFGYIEPRYIHKILWRVNRFFSGILNSDLYDFLSLIFKCTHSSAELIYPGMTNVIFSQSIVINPMLVRLVFSCPAHHTCTVDESQNGA